MPAKQRPNLRRKAVLRMRHHERPQHHLVHRLHHRHLVDRLLLHTAAPKMAPMRRDGRKERRK
eukprot:7008764-Karenia_brevis.AAC.1